jgi:hypothetical protein
MIGIVIDAPTGSAGGARINPGAEAPRLQHSGIGYVPPAVRHAGDDVAILAARRAVYQRARRRHPERWAVTCASGTARSLSLSTRRTAAQLTQSLLEISCDNNLDSYRCCDVRRPLRRNGTSAFEPPGVVDNSVCLMSEPPRPYDSPARGGRPKDCFA